MLGEQDKSLFSLILSWKLDFSNNFFALINLSDVLVDFWLIFILYKFKEFSVVVINLKLIYIYIIFFNSKYLWI